MVAWSVRLLPALLLIAASFALSVGLAEAVAPANDNFVAAAAINSGSVDNVVTTDATLEGDEVLPGCQSSINKSVWYRHVAADDRVLTVSTDGSAFDTVVAVYRAPDSTPAYPELIQVACDDDLGEGNTSLATFVPMAGATYFVQVAGFAGASGSLQMRFGHAPPNDEVSQAIAVAPPYSDTFENAVTTNETFELTPCGVSRAVWYKATLPAGSYSIKATGTGDPALGVYFGPPSASSATSLSLWDCNDDSGSGLDSSLNLVVDFAANWYFQVGGAGGIPGAYAFSIGVIPDADADGVRDGVDNCPQYANGPLETLLDGIGNQDDADGDGVQGVQPPYPSTWGGDACDFDDDNDLKNDSADLCRPFAEDYDAFEDGDGCPETDNDEDGICDPGQTAVNCSGSDVGRYLWKNPLGATSDCRNVAEDIDSFHDGDGCPEPDNDYDNFPDATDDCPGTDGNAGADGIADTGDEPVFYLVPYQAREDIDGILDNDGCHDSPEDDYDGDSRGVMDGGLPIFRDTREALSLGTDPAHPCALTPTANDEAGPDAWPPDFNDSQSVSVTDVLAMKPVFTTNSPRHDLNASGSVSVTDVLLLKPYFGTTCVP